MAMFEYEATNGAGQVVKDAVEAGTMGEAMGKIRAAGAYPVKVKERRPAGRGNRSGGWRAFVGGGTSAGRRCHGRVGVRMLTEFTRQLSVLQDAGLPLVRALKVLRQQERAGVLKQVLADVGESVEGGSTLSEAFGRHPRAFDRLYVNMVAAGETGGVLDVILQRLADFMEKSQRLKRKIVGAMIYPGVVITFSVAIVMGIMMFVVPRFQEIFRDFKTTLPGITVGLLRVADFMAHQFGWVLVLGIPVVVWLMVRFIGKSVAGRHLLDRGKLKVPVVGRIVAKSGVSRFARTLGTLLSAGVPILEALTIARDTVGNAVFEKALKQAHDGVREGRTFAEVLRESRVCDAMVTNMIDVGEETGDLDKMLLKIADNYDEQIDVLVGSLVSLLEPVMVVVLGGIVGTIVVALFMPLVAILNQMNETGGK